MCGYFMSFLSTLYIFFFLILFVCVKTFAINGILLKYRIEVKKKTQTHTTEMMNLLFCELDGFFSSNLGISRKIIVDFTKYTESTNFLVKYQNWGRNFLFYVLFLSLKTNIEIQKEYFFPFSYIFFLLLFNFDLSQLFWFDLNYIYNDRAFEINLRKWNFHFKLS